MPNPISVSSKSSPTIAATSTSHGSHASSSSTPPPPSPPLTGHNVTFADDDPSNIQEDMDKPPPSPTVPPLHFAAQRGDLESLSQLLDPPPGSHQQPADPDTRDAQNITALHWAAINNQLVACKMLLEKGAEVDVKGGELEATPLHWAARNGYTSVVHLLLSYNADAALTDSQSFNALHLAVHSSSALLVTYLLFTSQPLSVDTPDNQGHTSLGWACYQGDALSVESILKAGADPNKQDDAGLTPLHWSVVKGNSGCIRRVLEAGGDPNKRERQGKTPKDLAVELKSEAAWKRALREAGRDELDCRVKPTGGLFLKGEKQTKMAILFLPWFFLFLGFWTLSLLPWWSGLLLALGEGFAMHHVITKVLLDMRGNGLESDKITKSPYLAGIISGSVFWVGYVWVTRFVNGTPGYGMTNLVFGLCCLLCSYNFLRAVNLDPGYVPKPPSDAELKEMIEELVTSGRYDGQNFCLACMVRKPLRSKHCRLCNRCTARHDHHCPWIWNCIGVNNHRQFVLFVLFLILGIISFDRLAIAYYTEHAPTWIPAGDGFDSSCPMPTPLCTASHYDTFALAVAFWATLQLTWTIILLGGQLWQVARQMTTLEVSNLGRYGYMGGRGGTSLAEQTSHAHQHAHAQNHGAPSTSPTDLEEGEAGHRHGPECRHGHGHAHGHRRSHHSLSISPNSSAGFLLKILGLDRFTRGKAADGLAKSGKANNPFDIGMWTNCVDFWSRGRELGVDYRAVYDIPPHGFLAAKASRARAAQLQAELSNSGGGIRKGKGVSLPMAMGSNNSRTLGGATYSPLSQQESA